MSEMVTVTMPADPPEDLLRAERAFDEVLFGLCRADDYAGLYREFVRRFALLRLANGGYARVTMTPDDPNVVHLSIEGLTGPAARFNGTFEVSHPSPTDRKNGD